MVWCTIVRHHTEVHAKRVDTWIINKQSKTIAMLEMSCPTVKKATNAQIRTLTAMGTLEAI